MPAISAMMSQQGLAQHSYSAFFSFQEEVGKMQTGLLDSAVHVELRQATQGLRGLESQFQTVSIQVKSSHGLGSSYKETRI